MSLGHGSSIVRDGLVLHLDAANVKSYPGTGSTWNDISGNGADCTMVGSPVHTQNGGQSYWQLGSGQGFESIPISQTYKDLMILMKLETNTSILAMAFGVYNDVDVSLRFLSGQLRLVSVSNTNDWQFGSTESELFVNGNFNAGATDVYNRWTMIRAYKESTSPFRYEVSSQFAPGGISRPYIGKIASIMSYNRKLTDAEVQQNFEATRGRYGI